MVVIHYLGHEIQNTWNIEVSFQWCERGAQNYLEWNVQGFRLNINTVFAVYVSYYQDKTVIKLSYLYDVNLVISRGYLYIETAPKTWYFRYVT